MNYEKKYKEIVGQIKKAYLYAQTDSTKAVLEEIFPELAESEDEKVRKRISQALHGDVLDFDEIIQADAWLEKQKDCIKLSDSAYTSNRDVIEFADKYSHAVWENLMDNYKRIANYSIGCNDVSDIVLNAIIDTYNWLEKQGKHKPVISDDALREGIAHFGITQYQIDNWLKKYVDIEKQASYTTIVETGDGGINALVTRELPTNGCDDEQKSADTVEPKFKVGDRVRYKGHVCDGVVTEITDTDYICGNAKLPISTQDKLELIEQKPAWSEEDEHRIKDTIYFLDTAKKHYASTEELDACIDWLQSLRPHNHWKPSELQLECLSDAIEYYNSLGYPAPKLKELLDDLKKIKEGNV